MIKIKCIRGSGDREYSSVINDPLISSESSAVSRGKRWIDDNYYLIKKRTLRVPHVGSNAKPGQWIKVSDGKLGLSNSFLKVKSYTVKIDKSGVWAIIETDQYEVFLL